MSLALQSLLLRGIGHFVFVDQKGVDVLQLCVVGCPSVGGIPRDAFLVAFQNVSVAGIEPIGFAHRQLVAKPWEVVA